MEMKRQCPLKHHIIGFRLLRSFRLQKKLSFLLTN